MSERSYIETLASVNWHAVCFARKASLFGRVLFKEGAAMLPMNQVRFWAAAALLLTCVTVRAADDNYDGKVISVSDNTLMVMVKGTNDNRSFAVSAETKITRNGKPAKLSDIQMGDKAQVTASGTAPNLAAKEIVAVAAK
jgi:hypothetical protein